MKLLVAFLLWLAAFGAWASPAKPLSIEEHNNLIPARICLDNAANFQKKGIVTSEAAYQSAVAECLSTAKTVLGRDIAFNDLLQGVKTTPELTTSQKVVGWVTGFTWLQMLATIGVGIFGSIFLFYSFPLLVAIPKEVYEFGLYAGAVGLSAYGLTLSSGGHLYGLIGVLLFAGSLTFTVHAHKLKGDGWGFFAVIAVYAAVFAFLYQSTMIGFVAVTALLAAAGFMAHAFGLGYVIGFADEKSVPLGTFVAFLLVAIFVGMRMGSVDQPYIQVFAPGAYWMGSFVGFIGLLIMTSKWYTHGMDTGRYVLTNVFLMPVAGIGAIVIGSMYGVPELAKIGGTFFVLWAVEKYVEVTMHGLLSASFFGLVGCGGLLVFSNWALAHSDKVGPYLLFVS